MLTLTITVRDNDEAILKQVAERDWRTAEQEASALLEQTLAAQRAKANGTAKPQGRRGPRAQAA